MHVALINWYSLHGSIIIIKRMLYCLATGKRTLHLCVATGVLDTCNCVWCSYTCQLHMHTSAPMSAIHIHKYRCTNMCGLHRCKCTQVTQHERTTQVHTHTSMHMPVIHVHKYRGTNMYELHRCTTAPVHSCTHV